MSKLKIIIPLLLIAVFMVSTYSVVADSGSGSQDSQDTPDHNVPTEQEHADARQVQVQNSSNGIEIESDNHFNGTSNNIHIEIQADGGLSINFGFSGETVNHTESELHIKLRARSMVEFIDNNTAVPGYDLNDTLVNKINFNNLTWSFTVSNTTVSNTTVFTIDAKAFLTSANTSSIDFNFVLSTGYAQITNATTLAPNAIKWTVVVSNYVFSSSQSKLALQMQMQSGTNNDGIESDHIANSTEAYKDGLTKQKESAVNFGNTTGSKGFFSWADNYSVDGVNESVVTSPAVSVDHEDNSFNQMYFTFNQGNVISWDPSVGVSRASLPSASLGLLSVNTVNTLSSVVSVSSSAKSTPGFEVIAVMLSIGVIALVSKKHLRK